MDYNLLPELNKYRNVRMPVKPSVLRAANLLMPLVQRGSKLYQTELTVRKVFRRPCSASLIRPASNEPLPCLVYYHGGAFSMKAASYHKNLVREYAMQGNFSVLFVDYRLAPGHPFPIPLKDCYFAYRWALKNLNPSRILVGGDSAGADLALSVIRLALRNHLRVPDGEMLIYPVADSRMETGSMKKYTDSPLWNSELNEKMWELYTNPSSRHDPLASPLEADSFAGYPEAYIETAEYDCLHDEGIALAGRLRQDEVKVELHETKGTIHGFDIAEDSPYVKNCVKNRIEFLRRIAAN